MKIKVAIVPCGRIVCFYHTAMHGESPVMKHSWDELDQYRGDLFQGQWPTIVDLLLITEQKFGWRNGFTMFRPQRSTLTFSEILAHVKRVSSYLQECGIAKGDRIIINGKNSPSWAIAYLATLYCGAIVVPLDNQLHIDRVENLSSYVEASFVFADKPVIEALDPQKFWYDNLKGLATLIGSSERFPTIYDLSVAKSYDRVTVDEHDLAAILFTSGTTGNEKGAMLTHANIVSDLYQACDGIFLSLDETDVLYALLPLHHSYCCTAVCWRQSNTEPNVFCHEIVVSRMINDLTQGKLTFFMGIPLLYNKLLAGMMKQVKKKGFFVNALIHTMMVINGFTKKHLHWNLFRPAFNKLLLSKIGLDHNHICICGAGPLSPKVFKQFQQLGIDFIQGYGLTETSPILTLNPVSHFKVESVGMVFPLVEMKIADPEQMALANP